MMKSLATLFLLPFLVLAAPTPQPRADNPAITDTDILNYALTLEHLENAYYSGALAKFDDAAFVHAGLPEFARGRFAQIAQHEQTHVAFLQAALGDEAVKPCTYSFPYTDPSSFSALAQILEGVGTSAYLGAAALIDSPTVLTAAGAILTTEARHAAWVASAVNKENPWSGSFDTPLGLNQVFSLAAAFIKECPAENPPLPVKAFPTLTIAGDVKPGGGVTVSFEGSGQGGSTFLALLSGLQTHFVPIENGKATIPDSLQGTVYAVITSDGQSVSDEVTQAGPAVLVFPFDSRASNP